MPDYKKCIIYTIKSGEGLYVGSTCNYNHRKYCHKSSLNNENAKNYNFKLYNTIRKNNGEWDMKPYAEFSCNNKMEMMIEEERIRKELKADLNMISCFRTEDERLNYHKDYNKDYKIKNKDELRDKNKNYQNINKEEIADKKKDYYIDNKEKLNEKFTCECGGKHTYQSKPRHFKTKKHSKYMLSKEA